jgi:hypothetical protein
MYVLLYIIASRLSNAERLTPNPSYMDSPRKQGNRSIGLAGGERMQSYIQHRVWARGGPCRHGICARSANRYKRQA